MIRLSGRAARLATILIALLCPAVHAAEPAAGPARFERDFAPSDGFVKPPEREHRKELCLNGLWQFQPMKIPAGWARNRGTPPDLPPPAAGAWDAVPIKIPSPWNVNAWGCGRRVGAGTDHPYWPDSVYYPSYPESWDSAEMGWLRRTFRVPADWAGLRVVLHFEAVAGHCQVLVNGNPAGEHFDKSLPFELDVSDLVDRAGENELLVGVRHHRLYNKQSPKHAKFLAPYPPGSNLEPVAGIWQDVFLLGLPAVRVDDVFVLPQVDQDALEVEVTLRNDSDRAQAVSVGGEIRPWLDRAGKDVLSAPEPAWALGDAALAVAPKEATVEPGKTATVRFRQAVGGKLSLWSPDAPNLYGLVLSVSAGGRVVDCRFERFGWRQLAIRGKDLLLNGQRIQLVGDLCHPFGPYMMSRRFVWAWYRMIKDANGNAVRPHANVYPRCYLDLADEMGVMVLDETALFGSSIQLNFEEPAAWERLEAHYDGLVRRDRNHPSVFGWSFGNELFAIFLYNPMPKEEADGYYAKLAALGLRARALDPTRPFITCDGDEDLRGTLPVWSKHYGHGVPKPPAVDKPMVVGESGGTYYATPGQLAAFNGGRAYESYRGRSEALAIDVYENIAKLARPGLTYYSASETVWFGLEHLGLGWRDASRLPTLRDGVFFAKPFEEGKPGMQLERIPPFVATLNPGWDAALPLYKPLPMFEAVKAAMAKGGPAPCPWDHRPPAAAPPAAPPAPTIREVAFAGDRAGTLFKRLWGWGAPLVEDGPAAAGAALLVVDGERLTDAAAAETKKRMDDVLARRGTVLVSVRSKDAAVEALNRILPAALQVTPREATALARRGDHPWTTPFGAADLYFAEESDRRILKCGLAGPLVKQGTVLLEASNTDWSLFNGVGENAKCAAVVLYEQLAKPEGAALVEVPCRGGRLALCAIDCAGDSPAVATLWRRLLASLGVAMQEPRARWLVPTARVERRRAAWRWTTEAPPADWMRPAFDDAAWKVGEAGFGGEVPGGRPRTSWTTADIWLRCTFDMPAEDPGDLRLSVHHDEDVEVYVNGELLFREPAHLVDYKDVALGPAQRKAFRPGSNVLAVHCHQTAGGQYIDVGIAAGAAPPDGKGKKEHDLLLDGPVK
jgi:beta-galactosidase